jgi:hypothetical protein
MVGWEVMLVGFWEIWKIRLCRATLARDYGGMTTKNPKTKTSAKASTAPAKRKAVVSPASAVKKRATTQKRAGKPQENATPKPLRNIRALKHVETSVEAVKSEELDAEELAIKNGGVSLWKPEYADLAHKMCAIMGATDKELAAVLDVSLRTIHSWKHQHPEFKEALTTGKAIADAQVAVALYKTAVGYEHDDMDIRTVTLPGMNAGSEIVMTPIVKIVQPNSQSIQWWLKNRRPADWKDKSEVTVETVNLDMEAATARFGDRMAEARRRQDEIRRRRILDGLKGD